jgi:pimeloyl-ACP methyl ester carboxylesterase
MKRPLAWFLRILFLVVVAALLAVGIFFAKAASWKADAIERLAAGAEIFETSAGPQQCAITGDGPPILVIHGVAGGYDQALAIASAIPLENNQILAPSRPGYLGTPLGTNILPSQQATALTALLDSQSHAKVTVLAFGNGAPVAVDFATRFPDRIDRLILISGVYERPKPTPEGGRPPLPREILTMLAGDVTSAVLAWTLEKDPARGTGDVLPLFFKTGAATATQLILANSEQTESAAGFLMTMLPVSPREPGLRNDLLQFQILQPLPANKIAVPTLVIHGNDDPLQPVEGARLFAAKIPGAVFLEIEGAGYLPWLGPDGKRAAAAISSFARGGL